MGKVAKSGGCQCGRVRYRAMVDPVTAYLCHCRMCQRATGGVAAALVNVAQGDYAWEGEPDWYESSPIARRPFCSHCGTPIGFSYNDEADLDFTIGSFDEPYDFVPQRHFAAESIHEAWLDTTHLPRKRTAESPAIVDRWLAATGKGPE